MYLDRLFKLMAEKQASDLFISCGAPISMKVNGVVAPLTNQPMDIDTVRRVAYELMSEEQAKTFESEFEMNLSHLDPTVGNFRINIFRQRGTISLVIRYVRSRHPLVRATEAASGPARARHGEAWARADRRRDRLRQIDDARGDDRSSQYAEDGPHPDDRRPDRVSVPATRRASSTSASSTSTR